MREDGKVPTSFPRQANNALPDGPAVVHEEVSAAAADQLVAAGTAAAAAGRQSAGQNATAGRRA